MEQNSRNHSWEAYVGSQQLVRFQVLTAASMKLRIFWDVLTCS
jgi:hypothetical protein